jgi:hypothetical protein
MMFSDIRFHDRIEDDGVSYAIRLLYRGACTVTLGDQGHGGIVKSISIWRLGIRPRQHGHGHCAIVNLFLLNLPF